MHITVVAVGKIKENFLEEGIKIYQKRLSSNIKIEIREVQEEQAPETLSFAELKKVKENEGKRILDQLPNQSYVIALDRLGKQWNSSKLTKHMHQELANGQKHFTFIIGGSNGLCENMLKQAHLKLSFGKMTYPHQLMRLILIEQIYRMHI